MRRDEAGMAGAKKSEGGCYFNGSAVAMRRDQACMQPLKRLNSVLFPCRGCHALFFPDQTNQLPEGECG